MSNKKGSIVRRKLHSNVLTKPNDTNCFIGFYGTTIFETDSRKISDLCFQMLNEVNQSQEAQVPIAFDMEWSFDYRSGPHKTALIQICKDLRVCFLFQIFRLPTLPEGLLQLLESSKAVFHGVKVKNDFRKLSKDFDEPRVLIQVERAEELGTFYNEIAGIKRNWSLANLAKELLKTNVSKEKNVRMSRWHYFPLTKEQKMYAAVDVYVGQLIYKKLQRLQREKEANDLSEDITALN